MIVGIDLGTTNSLVAAWLDGGPRLIPNVLGSTITPSCVSIDADGATECKSQFDTTLVGATSLA